MNQNHFQYCKDKFGRWWKVTHRGYELTKMKFNTEPKILK